ncbi:MAG TPA: M23 family metallopeptidase [Kofleriaceae bacterium]|nr:M23 family metallopeptidase [Kofleriaceae bacterium]
MRSLVLLTILGSSAIAFADPTVTVSPTSVHPGEAVLVTVTDATALPHGKAGGRPLEFFPAKHGYQAVFATPLSIDEDHVLVEVTDGAKPVSVAVVAKTFPETKLVVEEELANPDKEDGKKIDADNTAIEKAYAQAAGAPQFTRAFRRPPGALTSTFGEWRTFNDGHRAQHLGLDVAAREGARVAAVDAGTVALVRESFLMGNVVVIAHGAGISSLYFHLSKVTVAEGDRVKQGDRIGLAGHTGRTTGPHVHLSIHVDGGMVDPLSFLKLPLAPQ